jgi:hypothetical protein
VKILRYSEFDSSKRTVPENNESKGVSRAIMGHLEDFLSKAGKDASFEEASQYIASKVEGWELSKEDFEEAKEMMSEDLNEGFLDSILRFFKGIFDLFNDKEVKKEAEESQKYFSEIEDDEDITDDDLEDAVDTKIIRKSSDKFTKSITKRVETDEEKGIRTSKDLVTTFSSWLGMILVYEESIRMPLVEKMTKNPELAKRFTWVPKKWSHAGEIDTKDWYKQKECKPDSKILKAIADISKIDPAKKKEQVKKFAESFINYVVSQDERNGSKYKAQDKEYLDDLFIGLATMCDGIVEAMQGIIKNTQDAKLSEVIATEMIQNRKRRGKDKKPGEKPEDKSNTEGSRSRKGSKKTTTDAKPSDSKTTPKKETTKKDTK